MKLNRTPNPLDRNARNEENENWDRIEKLAKEINDLVLESGGTSNLEVVQARGGKPVLNDRINEVESKAFEANAKSSNPLAAMQASGQKVTLDLLSQEVKDAITGTTSIIDANGYLENNRGVVYPLKNLTRDGVLHEVQDRVKKSILSAKVIGAKPDKLYSIDWIGNGFVSDEKELWGMQISEYPRGESIDTSDQRILIHYSTNDFPEPTEEIVSRTVHIPEENIFFEITYDRAEFQGTALNIARAGGRGFGCVIHHDNYVYSTSRGASGDVGSGLWFSKKVNEFTVYSPSKNKAVGYTFVYTEKPYIEGDKTSNVKLWSFKKAAEYTSDLSLVRDFFPNATQDLMIREMDTTDYMGGVAHGDEVLQKVEIYVDGKKIDENEVVEIQCNEMKMFQTTFLYRDTITTNGVLEHVATAKKIHTVNKDGYSIEVTVEFLEELNLRSCLIGSLSLSRKDSSGNYIFDKAIIGSDLTEVDLHAVETEFERVPFASEAFIFGDGVSINWNAIRREFIEGESTWINNSPELQTKLYCNYAPVGYTTSVGEVFNQKTHYKYILS